MSDEAATAFDKLRDHVDALELPHSDKVALTRDDMLIECPDDGRQVLFRGACPKCGGESWVPAGHLNQAQIAALKQLLEEQAE